MAASDKKTWIVSYDICCPRRLSRIHRLLRREGASFQFSVFVVEADDGQLRDLLARMEGMINCSRDDVRAYRVPHRCNVWALGTQSLPAGIMMSGRKATDLLLSTMKAAQPSGRASECQGGL